MNQPAAPTLAPTIALVQATPLPPQPSATAIPSTLTQAPTEAPQPTASTTLGTLYAPLDSAGLRQELLRGWSFF